MHTSFKQGTHVVVHLKTGEMFVDQFEERRSRFVKLRGRGRVLKHLIRAITIKRH